MSQDSLQILSIKNKYKASFPMKISLMIGVKESVLSGTPESLVNAHEELHKLAGSAGMYGYSDIASLCRLSMEQINKQSTTEVLTSLEQLISLLNEKVSE